MGLDDFLQFVFVISLVRLAIANLLVFAQATSARGQPQPLGALETWRMISAAFFDPLTGANRK